MDGNGEFGVRIPNEMDRATTTHEHALPPGVAGELRRRGLCAMKVERVSVLQELERLAAAYAETRKGKEPKTEAEENLLRAIRR